MDSCDHISARLSQFDEDLNRSGQEVQSAKTHQKIFFSFKLFGNNKTKKTTDPVFLPFGFE